MCSCGAYLLLVCCDVCLAGVQGRGGTFTDLGGWGDPFVMTHPVKDLVLGSGSLDRPRYVI